MTLISPFAFFGVLGVLVFAECSFNAIIISCVIVIFWMALECAHHETQKLKRMENTPSNTSTNTPSNTSTNTPTNTSTNTPTNTPTTLEAQWEQNQKRLDKIKKE